jgi:hypothetical protein
MRMRPVDWRGGPAVLLEQSEVELRERVVGGVSCVGLVSGRVILRGQGGVGARQGRMQVRVRALTVARHGQQQSQRQEQRAHLAQSPDG